MKKIISLMMLIASTVMAAAPQSSKVSIENSCKIKAKEVAAETYKSCVTDSKAAELEKIKKSYQVKLKQMKAQYETELKRLGAQAAKAQAAKEAESAPVLEAPSAVTVTTAPSTEEVSAELPVVESPVAVPATE